MPAPTYTSLPRRGAMLVLVAIVLILLIIGAVFSVDVAYMHMVRAELRTATDAAARAGSEALARTQDPAQARAAAIAIASQNTVAGRGLTLDPADITFGSLAEGANGRFVFLPNETPVAAVRVNGRRDQSSSDGPVDLFFARVFSTNSFEPIENATAAANVRDVALVLDVSGSMAAANADGVSRLDALKFAVQVFLTEVQRESPLTRISLTSYSSSPRKLADLTDDFAEIQRIVNRFLPRGATAIGNGLRVGSDSLVNDAGNRQFAQKTIIIMTDGRHNTGPSPATTVNTAVGRGHQVHTITFGAGADQNLMRTVAEATEGGIHLHADTAADLTTTFRDIARVLSVTLIE